MDALCGPDTYSPLSSLILASTSSQLSIVVERPITANRKPHVGIYEATERSVRRKVWRVLGDDGPTLGGSCPPTKVSFVGGLCIFKPSHLLTALGLE